MTVPPMPPVPQPRGRRDPQGAPWPGLVPLRPLLVGEIFSAAARLVRAHAAVLCSVALIGNLASVGATLAILAQIDDQRAFFSGDWLNQIVAGSRTGIPAAALWPTAAAGIIGLITTILVSGLATAFAADDALGRPVTTAEALARLRGRWGALVGTSLLVGLAITAGLVLLVIPGLMALAALLLATPVVVLEKTKATRALGRSAELSRGVRWRLFGLFVLATVVASFVETLVGLFVPLGTTLAGIVPSMLVGAVVAALTTPWIAAVVALLYIDTRIRKENLAASLIRASQRVT